MDKYADLLKVIHEWASADDWGVPSIYVSTVEELAEALGAGVPVDSLVKHGKHTGAACRASNCRLAREFNGKGERLSLAQAWAARK